MEKFQSESKTHSHNQIPSITAIVAGLALSACTSTPPHHSYTPPQNKPEIRYLPIHIDPPPTLISKSYTHNWPLGDKICTYIYSNKEKTLSLCSPKPDKEIRKYSKSIPGETKYIPWRTEYWYGYWLRSDGKYGYWYGLQNIPPKSTYIPWKTLQCIEKKSFNQFTWAALANREDCF